jgi:hypothetical protein
MRSFINHTPYYYYSDQINEAEMSGACGSNRKTRNTYKGLVRKPEAETRLGIPRHWQNNIKLDL